MGLYLSLESFLYDDWRFARTWRIIPAFYIQRADVAIITARRIEEQSA
jgi:hypothetical protein